MALTRPKYSQIYDSDFKNSARVATTSSVTLTGGAPTVVDGITLVEGDRVLVRAQTTGSQNGIYRVNTLGTGANGTWGRTLDADTSTKLSPGTSLSIEEGTTLGGKMYRMTSAGPITLGTTEITWTDVSGGGGASTGGTNGQVQYNDTNALNGATYLYYNKVTGQVTANSGIASTSTTSGSFIVTGGAGVSGNINANTVFATGTSDWSAFRSIGYNQRGGTGYHGFLDVTNTYGSATNPNKFFRLNSDGAIEIINSAYSQNLFTLSDAGQLYLPQTISSTSTTSGALRVAGGAGIAGNLYVGGDATVTGNLTVNGTTTNINTTNLVVEDKNIVLADVTTPTDVTADGAGITIKGATDKTLNWVDATDAWTSSEDFNLLTGKQYEIAGTSVLTATTLGSGVVNSSLTSVGTITSLAATTAVATNFSSGNIRATNSTSGTWSTANVSLYNAVTAFTSSTTFYPTFSNISTTGNTIVGVATNLSFNANTGNLTAVGHVGTHWGPVAATTANVSGTSNFSGATNHAAGITASTVSAGTIGNSGATLTGTLNTAAQTNITSVGTLTSLTTSGNLSVPDASLITGGNIRLGDWPQNSAYTSIQQAGMSGSEYGLLMGKTDKNTYLSSWTGGAVNIRGGANSNAYQITVSGSAITITGNVTPAANLTYNLGSTTAWWNNMYGVSVQAKYADLAEHYEPDQGYATGTVVVFGGEREITQSTQDHDPRVAGVISTNPAYLMNAANPGLPVALQGRVPCQVLGPVAKGDVLVTSNIPGVAQRIDPAKFLPGCVVGKALEAINTNTIQTIEVVVGRF